MQFILHRVYYKGVSCIFHIPARVPSDTNKACHNVNSNSTLAGGNVLLFTAKVTLDPLVGFQSHPSCLQSQLGWLGPQSLVEFKLSV